MTIDFFFEFGSTYSYPAALRVENVVQAAGLELRWRPFLLGPIFSSQGFDDSPFNLQPAKGRYMWRDLERLCQAQGIPYSKPTVFPRNGLVAARIATAARAETWLPDFVRAVYGANFAKDRDIADSGIIAEILVSLGIAPEPWLEKASSQEVKNALRAETDEAVRLGLFGAPMFVVDEELFWGNDRLESAIDYALTLSTPQ